KWPLPPWKSLAPICAPMPPQKSAAMANGNLTCTIPTKPASNSWNSPQSKNRAAPSSLLPTRNHDRSIVQRHTSISLRAHAIALAVPSPSPPLLPNRPLPPSSSLPRPKSRQAPRQHRRRCHRLRLRTRWPHRFLRPPHVQNQKIRPPARRHLSPRHQRQAPPPLHRREIYERRQALHLS